MSELDRYRPTIHWTNPPRPEMSLDATPGGRYVLWSQHRRLLKACESEAGIARDAFKDSEARCAEWIKTAESYRRQVVELETQLAELNRRAVQ